MSRLETLIAEESGRLDADPAWPKTRRMRWELLHTGARLDQWPGAGIFVAMKGLRDLGYTTTKSQEHGTTVYRAAPGNGQRPAGRPTRGRPPGSKTRIHATTPEPVQTPELGANLVVFALVAHEGEVAIGLLGRDGRQWMATLTAEPPLP
jgi:hypothetical protein